jgi:hypothetical protein
LEDPIHPFFFFADEKVPKIVLLPRDQIVKKSGWVQFDCAYDSENKAETRWYFHDNGLLKNSSRYIFNPYL